MPEAEAGDEDKTNDGYNDDGFVYKERKSKRTRKKKAVSTTDRLSIQIQEHKDELQSSDMWKASKGQLAKYEIKRIVGYGLGSIETSFISRQQLAFLLLIMDETKCHCEVFDPIFTELDKEVLKTFNIIVSDANTQAQQKLSELTLVYMPHCGKALYNNIISSNWCKDDLANVVLIGNRLDMYLEKSTTATMQKRTPMLLRSLDVLESVEFLPFSHNDRAFNDLAWSTFEPLKVVDWSVQNAEEHKDTEMK